MLNRLNLSIKTGEKIALVGESGCGKSTVIQIIQRLYDLDKGCLDLQGTNIEALNLPYVRYGSQLINPRTHQLMLHLVSGPS